MQRADAPTDAAPTEPDAGPRQGAISVALLAALALVPIVVAVGFLTDRGAPTAAVPDDIAVLSLRGGMDGGGGPRPPIRPRAAGF